MGFAKIFKTNYFLNKMIFKCKNCGTSDNKHAKELCEKCYHKKWFNEYCVKQEVKKRQMDYNKNWRRKNPERVK